MTSTLARITVVSLLCLSLPVPVLGQNAASRSRWTLEILAGGGSASQSTAGKSIDRWPTGDEFTKDGGGTSRFQSTWRFGDGAELLNGVIANFSELLGRELPRIVPLDTLLQSPGDRPGTRKTIGLRVARTLSPQWSIEASVERSSGGLTVDNRWTSALEEATASFDDAFTALLSTAPVTALVVESTLTLPDSTQAHTRVLAAATRSLVLKGKTTVLGTVGAGMQLTSGSAVEVAMTGRYTFRLFNNGTVTELDTVRIRFDDPAVPIGLLGLGIQRDLTTRTALRLDARLLLTPNRVTTEVTTFPRSELNSTAAVLPTTLSPGLQFSNQTTPPSTLRADSGTTLRTFTGSGINRQVVLTLGMVMRF